MSGVLEAEGLTIDYLNRYPSGPHAEQVRGYAKKISLRKMELEFEQHIKGGADADHLTPIERLYLEAMSHARFEPDQAIAKLRALIDLYSLPEKDRGNTALCLALAQRQLARLTKQLEKTVAEERVKLKEKLDAADALRKSDPNRAKAMYRAIVELYGEKPWAAAAVRRAREALKP